MTPPIESSVVATKAAHGLLTYVDAYAKSVRITPARAGFQRRGHEVICLGAKQDS